MMQARLRSLGAAAVIRTGRSAAFIDCALAREEGQPAVDVRTEVRPRAIAPGTLWHLMVPLDPQLRLL